MRGEIDRLELIKCEAVRDWMAAEPPRARTLNGQFDDALRAAQTRRGGGAPMPTFNRQRVATKGQYGRLRVKLFEPWTSLVPGSPT